MLERLRARRERHRERGPVYRGLFAAVGFTVLAAGVALLVLPGPGIPVVVAGLFMLGLEFAWAERLLERTVAQSQRAKEASRTRKATGAAAAGVGALAVAAAFLLWDVPFLPG